MIQNRFKLRGWQKYDGNGFMIPGTAQYRPLNVVPKDGIWREIPSQLTNLCCNPGACYITFINTTASANITSISTTDGRISWTGLLENGGYLTFEIPNCYDETFTIVTSTFSGRTLTNATVQGDGTISTIGSLAAVTNTFTTTSDTGSQYTVILS